MNAIPFGRYVLIQKIALGGTAEIFRAKLLGIEGFEKEVVIKRILPPWSANPQFISMLIDEAKILVKLQHDKIVQVFELGREDDLYYISMEYVRGWDLRHIFKHAKEDSKTFHLSECLYILTEILTGLDYIHKQTDKHGRNLEIVHRDISPQNILISTEGKVKITDFGIAHARSRSFETATGVIKGKFSYMSPEQARGENLNLKTDLFACGILLYEMLCGQKLFQGKKDLELLDEVRNFKAADTLKNTLVPKPLWNILHRALAEETQHRYSSAQEFLQDIQSAAQQLGESKGEAVFLKRLQKLPPPDSENAKLPFKTIQNVEAHTQAIVSREWVSDTSMEITRSLEHAFDANTDRNKAPPLKSGFSSKKWMRGIGLFIFIIFAAGFFIFQTRAPQNPEMAVIAKPAPESQSVIAESQPLTVQPEIKTETKASPQTKREILPIQKGNLSVRASPWGKISVSGIASNVEKPLHRSLAYGTYKVSVSYQNNLGQWNTLSQSVKISKASTVCSAHFQTDGKGVIRCR